MHSMPKEKIVVVEEGADLLRDAVVREPSEWERHFGEPWTMERQVRVACLIILRALEQSQ